MRFLAPMHGRSHLPTGSDPIDFSGFIRYVFENVGEWLYVETTGEVPDEIADIANGAGIVFATYDNTSFATGVAVVLPGDDDLGHSYNGSFAVYTTAGISEADPQITDEIFAVANDALQSEIRLGWNHGNFGQTTDILIDTSGGDLTADFDNGTATWTDLSLFTIASAIASVDLPLGGMFRIRDHTNAVIFEVDEDGTITPAFGGNASAVPFTPVGTIAATDVQAAIAEVASEAATDLANHLTDATDAHDASAISIVDAGNYFTGTDVEAVLQEVGAGGGGAATSFSLLTNGDPVSPELVFSDGDVIVTTG